MFFGNLHFKILLIFRGQICFENPENSSLEPSKCKTSYYVLLRCRKYLLRKHRKNSIGIFFWEKLPTRTLGNSWKFSHLLSWTLLWYFCQKKIFSFLWAGPFGLYQTQRLYSFRKNFVYRLYRLFTLNSKCNCVTAFSQKIKSLQTQIYQFQEYLLNLFQY